MKFRGVKILRNSMRNKEKGLKRKEFESKKYSRKKRLKGVVFVLWPNSLEQLSS